ncbi:helix-turn-helix domain-containing protein [Noviherbaspirillum sp. Root189]|uniref:helix-turn-helix domain-containing protein n=1 Tax=Noviherbaspirillum sp. Root189 TaxID=1736487 RepID=UPI00070C9680|nr:hypothetical protein ASE07_06300 [Noviherbaspirillum sp. Root189]
MLILLPMDIALILAKLLEKGLTQTEIANEIGCTQPSISAMAAGKFGKSRPSYAVVEGLKRLAMERGISTLVESKTTSE